MKLNRTLTYDFRIFTIFDRIDNKALYIRYSSSFWSFDLKTNVWSGPVEVDDKNIRYGRNSCIRTIILQWENNLPLFWLKLFGHIQKPPIRNTLAMGNMLGNLFIATIVKTQDNLLRRSTVTDSTGLVRGFVQC